MDTEKSAWKHA